VQGEWDALSHSARARDLTLQFCRPTHYGRGTVAKRPALRLRSDCRDACQWHANCVRRQQTQVQFYLRNCSKSDLHLVTHSASTVRENNHHHVLTTSNHHHCRSAHRGSMSYYMFTLTTWHCIWCTSEGFISQKAASRAFLSSYHLSSTSGPKAIALATSCCQTQQTAAGCRHCCCSRDQIDRQRLPICIVPAGTGRWTRPACRGVAVTCSTAPRLL
jgi:hypothetical protein